jgi:hypothetical protein
VHTHTHTGPVRQMASLIFLLIKMISRMLTDAIDRRLFPVRHGHTNDENAD